MTQSMLFTMGLAIVGQVVYQIGQRAVPVKASPFAVLTIAYFAAGILCVALSVPFNTFASGNLRAALAWPTWIIAIAIVAIEVGYLTAYRAGWTISTAFVTSSTGTILLLTLVGLTLLGNTLSARQVAGLVCACVAVWLLSSGAAKP